MIRGNQADFKYFQGYCDFVSACRMHDIPYPQFHLFECVNYTPHNVIGQIVGIRYGQRITIEDEPHKELSWLYQVSTGDTNQYVDVPENKIKNPLAHVDK